MEEVEELLPEEEIKEELKLETIAPAPTKKEDNDNKVTYDDSTEIKHEIINHVIKVTLESPFDKFYVLIIPNQEGKNIKDFYLFCEGFGIVVYMFGLEVENDREAVEIARSNGVDYIDIENYI